MTNYEFVCDDVRQNLISIINLRSCEKYLLSGGKNCGLILTYNDKTEITIEYKDKESMNSMFDKIVSLATNTPSNI